jgi:hypothetical protein
MTKMFEADLKRLQSILVSYEDKAKDLSQFELEQRNEVVALLRQSLSMLKAEIKEQTDNFQHGFLPPVSSLEETVDHPTD